MGLAYGGSWPADKPIELFRFANRVPLLFQRGACGITEAIVKTDWRNYLLSQPKGSLPVGPMALLVHVASVWVPFTSESKEAVAHYPEIIREIQLAAQECGRKLARAHPQAPARGVPGAAPRHLRALHRGGGAGHRQDHRQEPAAHQARVPAGRREGDRGRPGGAGQEAAVEEASEKPTRRRPRRVGRGGGVSHGEARRDRQADHPEDREARGDRPAERQGREQSVRRDPRSLARQRGVQHAQAPHRAQGPEAEALLLQRRDGQEVHADLPGLRCVQGAHRVEEDDEHPRPVLHDEAHPRGDEAEHLRGAGGVRSRSSRISRSRSIRSARSCTCSRPGAAPWSGP